MDSNSTVVELLETLHNGIDRGTPRILPGSYERRTAFIDESILSNPIKNISKKFLKHNSTKNDEKKSESNHSTAKAVDWQRKLVKAITKRDEVADRALGCMLGMVAGDALGAPLEFIDVRSRYEFSDNENEEEDATGTLHPFQFMCQNSKKTRPPHLKLNADGSDFVYVGENNVMRLKRGQWTDDASMGIAMAESLLANGKYHGGDVRTRFYCWWLFGYCNAFRFDFQRPNRGSVGLGGNIGQSLKDLAINYLRQSASKIPPRYETKPGKEDAGNGSLMRLAPIPIRFHTSSSEAMQWAAESSYTTHPGPDAANCCRFLAYFCTRAMHRSQRNKIHERSDKMDEDHDEKDNNNKSCSKKEGGDQNDLNNIRSFLLAVINDFLALPDKKNFDCPSLRKLVALLTAEPPSSKEACWNWQAERLAVEETLTNRGHEYNGYPVTAGYFGSYCMDGLAMALWAVAGSTSLIDCLLRVVNLGGDADTTGSIAGQMAGAYYGYQSSFVADPLGQRLLKDIHQWDPHWEIELRALLLCRDGKNAEGAASTTKRRKMTNN